MSVAYYYIPIYCPECGSYHQSAAAWAKCQEKRTERLRHEELVAAIRAAGEKRK